VPSNDPAVVRVDDRVNFEQGHHPLDVPRLLASDEETLEILWVPRGLVIRAGHDAPFSLAVMSRGRGSSPR
jgi:hypothetical protein